jgi:hypothetical protein
MTSAIDPTLPIFGFPTTQSVRNNFQIAHDEITALQAATAAGPFLPLIGGEITGQLQVDGNVRIGGTVDAGFKLDVTGTAHVLGAVTLDGAVQLNNAVTFGQNTVGAPIFINGPAGAARFLRFNTAGVLRWQINENATAESGANTGSDLDITNYSDAGAPITNPLMRMMRATGNVSIGSGVDAGFRLDVVGTGRFSGLLTATAGAQVSGTLAVGTNTTGSPININGPAGSAARQLTFLTAGLSRWALRANQIAEGGGNVGSDLDLLGYDDSGAVLYNPAFRFTRSTGLATHYFGLSLGSTLAPGGVTDLSRGLALYSTTFGFNVTSNRLNLVTPSGASAFINVGGVDVAQFNSSGITANTITQPTGTDNTALASTRFANLIAGSYGSATIADADTVLTPLQTGYPNLAISGTLTADRAVTLPTSTIQRNWVIANNTTGGFNIIVGFGSGATFTIPSGNRMAIFWTTAQASGLTNLFSPSLRVGDATRNCFNVVTGATGQPTTLSGGPGAGGLNIAYSQLGFFGVTPVAKAAALTGSCTTNTAAILKALCAALGTYGLVQDSTSA